jgi:hypothetical protein
MDANLFRSREEARRRAIPVPWTPPLPDEHLWAPLASASLVAGQVRRQLGPCVNALRLVGLDGCAYRLQRLDHVLERIATAPDLFVASGAGEI